MEKALFNEYLPSKLIHIILLFEKCSSNEYSLSISLFTKFFIRIKIKCDVGSNTDDKIDLSFLISIFLKK